MKICFDINMRALCNSVISLSLHLTQNNIWRMFNNTCLLKFTFIKKLYRKKKFLIIKKNKMYLNILRKENISLGISINL